MTDDRMDEIRERHRQGLTPTREDHADLIARLNVLESQPQIPDLQPNGTWHHAVYSSLCMVLTYDDACAVENTLREALRQETVAPSYVAGVTRVRDFLWKRVRIVRRVTVENVSTE